MQIWRSVARAIRVCKRERNERKDIELSPRSDPKHPTLDSPKDSSSSPAAANMKETQFPVLKFLTLFLVLGIVTAHSIIVGTPTRVSFVGIQMCSDVYYGVLVAIFPVLAIIVVIVSAVLIREAKRKAASGWEFGQDEFRWSVPRVFILSMMSLLAGLTSSLLGLGGGAILSPLLLELGLEPDSVSGTVTLMILFTSGSSVIQYSIAGKIPWDYGVMFALIGLLTSVLGQVVIVYVMRKFNRKSILVWTMVVQLTISLALLVVVGGLDLSNRLNNSGFLGFKPLC